MILKEILDYFEIDAVLPEYLYGESFNEVFIKGEMSKTGNGYKIVIKTQKDVIHNLIISPDDDYPVVVSSILPNGKRNGVKFGQNSDDLVYI